MDINNSRALFEMPADVRSTDSNDYEIPNVNEPSVKNTVNNDIEIEIPPDNNVDFGDFLSSTSHNDELDQPFYDIDSQSCDIPALYKYISGIYKMVLNNKTKLESIPKTLNLLSIRIKTLEENYSSFKSDICGRLLQGMTLNYNL